METVRRLDLLVPREVARKQTIKDKRRGHYLAQSMHSGEIYVADDMDPLIGALNECRHPEHRLKRSCAYACCGGKTARHMGFVFRNVPPALLAELHKNPGIVLRKIHA